MRSFPSDSQEKIHMTPLDAVEIETGSKPTATIIVLHGLGADGNDLVPVARELELGEVGDIRFVFPHAPVIPVTINDGYPMPAWYDLLGMELVRREDEVGLHRSLEAMEQLLDREKQRGMPAHRIVLVGFSQGCAMALATAVRHRERLGGVVGLSGYMPLAQTTAAERSDANAHIPIFMGHGQRDGVVPFVRGTDTRDMLLGLGYAVDWHTYPIEHAISGPEIADVNRWLLKILARP
jgi:phospholipase/carboxylesterase